MSNKGKGHMDFGGQLVDHNAQEGKIFNACDKAVKPEGLFRDQAKNLNSVLQTDKGGNGTQITGQSGRSGTGQY